MVKQSLGPKTLGLPAPAWVVGTYGPDGRANAMTVAWAGIHRSSPPCVGLSIGGRHYTHENIVARRAFTVNVASDRHVREVDYFGLVSGRDVDKFAVTGLTAVRSELVDAPYVAEFPLVLECEVYAEHDAGRTTFFIGEIKDVKADESVLGEKDLPDPGKVRPLIYGSGLRQYYRLGDHLAPAYSIGRVLESEED